MSEDKRAKCSNRNCGWIGTESQMRTVVLESSPLKVTELHCPRCDCKSFYYRLKPGEVERPKSGAQLIALERGRQLKIEGWSAPHDDGHDGHELTRAAIAYALELASPKKAMSWWPWDFKFWKPSSDPVRNLVKAVALIAAEIDRLQRVAAAATDRTLH